MKAPLNNNGNNARRLFTKHFTNTTQIPAKASLKTAGNGILGTNFSHAAAKLHVSNGPLFVCAASVGPVCLPRVPPSQTHLHAK